MCRCVLRLAQFAAEPCWDQAAHLTSQLQVIMGLCSHANGCLSLPVLAGKTLAFLLPLCMRVRALRQAAEEAADEGEGEEGEEREAELEAEAEGLKAVVVR